ncbi:MAG: FHA domain-containing protein [Bradymonadales bacterium]|jgi:pSer/pThr/pTyr-binding forkhead associated (FHA) protein
MAAGKGEGFDDLLTNALLEILGQDEELEGGTREMPQLRTLPEHDARAMSAAPMRPRSQVDLLSDSGLSDLFYKDEANDSEVHCRSCGAVCPRSHKYCGFCAAYLGDYTSVKHFEPIELEEIQMDISLVSINEDSTDGVHIPLKYSETIIGRSGDSRFPTDAFLSPRHARLIVDDLSLYIEDLDSLNGTFLRTRNEVRLSPGDSFLAGRQLLRFERFEQVVSTKARSVDGTRYMGSPPSGGDFKLVQIGIGNIAQNVYCLSEGGAVFGREKGDIIFPKDRFMSGRHSQIAPREDGNYYLLDLNSSNGTWIKIAHRTKLAHGDLIFLGQQLLRIESRDIM